MNAKLLLVDDESQIRRVIRTAAQANGYTTEEASSALEALNKIREERFDLILLDVNMPGMSGLEACEEIRRTSDVAIIMLTVRDSEKDKVAALNAGADDYVTKPFGMPELLARIRANLRRVPYLTANGPAIIRFGNVEIHNESRHVFVDGNDVRLTPKEFDLLHYLASHPNITIPHRKLLQTVWGPDYGEELAYLHVFVNQIRKKIEPDPSKPRHLLTEPRTGYRFSL
jgi:two-component system, OmpR family, KDP operon response regulator KdpE